MCRPSRPSAWSRWGRWQLLLWLRRSITLQAYTEISLYLHRRANPDSLYAAAYRRFAGVELPPGDYVGARDLFATGPLYAQSYLYANMIATQLREAMREQFGVDDLTREPRVGAWLTDRFFAPGASVPWRGEGAARHRQAPLHRCPGPLPRRRRPAGGCRTFTFVTPP